MWCNILTVSSDFSFPITICLLKPFQQLLLSLALKEKINVVTNNQGRLDLLYSIYAFNVVTSDSYKAKTNRCNFELERCMLGKLQLKPKSELELQHNLYNGDTMHNLFVECRTKQQRQQRKLERQAEVQVEGEQKIDFEKDAACQALLKVLNPLYEPTNCTRKSNGPWVERLTTNGGSHAQAGSDYPLSSKRRSLFLDRLLQRESRVLNDIRVCLTKVTVAGTGDEAVVGDEDGDYENRLLL
ncbi:hypothetical protein Tco_0134883 [Tanacetum coccineum]